MMIYILFTDGGYSEATIDSVIQTKYGGNSHSCYIKEVATLIHTRDRKNYEKFNNIMRDLREFRKNSDYKEIEITEDEANKATDFSTNVTDLLKYIFRI